MEREWNLTWNEQVRNGKVVVFRPEALFLGALLGHGRKDTQDDWFSKLEYQITDLHFTTQEGKKIWEKTQKLRAADVEINVQTLAQEFMFNGNLENTVAASLFCLFDDDCGAYTMNPNHYAKAMLVDYIGKLLREATRDMDQEGNGVERVLKLQRALENIQKGQSQGFQMQKVYGMPESVDAFIAELEERYQQREQAPGVATGYEDLDEKTRFSPGHLVIIGGRASVGKTTAALNMMVNMMQAGKKIVFFSLEMARSEIVQNFTAITAAVGYQAMTKAELSEDELDRIAAAARVLYDKKCVIYDEGNQTIENLTSKIYSAAQKLGGLDAIFIDHIHIIRGESKKTMRENMVDISAKLKALAKEWSVPVVALAQMNRDADKRQDKRPQLSDLKESGSIEQDADTILFVYRDSLYKSEDGGSPRNKLEMLGETKEDDGSTEIICRKNRHGTLPFFTVKMKVDGFTKRMTEFSKETN